MSSTLDPRCEHSSTYFVQDRSNATEMERLILQDRMLTRGMGGVLPEQPDPTRFVQVLDVGCGTGGWLIEMAKTYPTCEVLIGAEVSSKMAAYARAQAKAEQVYNRVEFHVMDALRMLEFPDRFFDLVNQRAGASWLRTWEWGKLLQEYRRVIRPGGVIRITESQIIPESTSPALTCLCELLVQALFRAGHLFTPKGDGAISELAGLFHQHGVRQVQTRACTLNYCVGTTEWQGLLDDVRLGFKTLVPFLLKWAHVPDNYDEIYRQALIEMQQPNFNGAGSLLTVWGTNL